MYYIHYNKGYMKYLGWSLVRNSVCITHFKRLNKVGVWSYNQCLILTIKQLRSLFAVADDVNQTTLKTTSRITATSAAHTTAHTTGNNPGSYSIQNSWLLTFSVVISLVMAPYLISWNFSCFREYCLSDMKVACVPKTSHFPAVNSFRVTWYRNCSSGWHSRNEFAVKALKSTELELGQP